MHVPHAFMGAMTADAWTGLLMNASMLVQSAGAATGTARTLKLEKGDEYGASGHLAGAVCC